jgi:hypothetical protein
LTKALEGQAGKQLGLRVQFGTAAVRVEAEHVAASGQGVANYAERDLVVVLIPHFSAAATALPQFSTEHRKHG